MNKLNIIMYHYVRPIKGTDFYNIKGLELHKFERQLDFLEENYKIVTLEEIKLAISNKIRLPNNSCWLTFDDGFLDHYKYVLPELKKRKLQGTFFPAVGPIFSNKILDVHAIHFIIATMSNPKELKQNLDKLCLKNNIKEEDLLLLWKNYGKPNRFDEASTIYVKRLLQHALPEDMRSVIIEKLFEKCLGFMPNELCSKLYMTEKQISELISERYACRQSW